MLFPLEQDYLNWTSKYNLRVKTGSCLCCGKEIVTDVPFALKGYRGLKSEDHGCGEEFTWKSFKPIGQKEKDTWDSLTISM
ncbi:hypothetical protein [Halobacteriovorax sp. JY17]|uniref:hypothetical protein n=1 Tax=Halobacteriovorax sp. JY17 TaxID=2014617 RepID=UPI000C546D76|nr:hypothetical protein [Halobacteriovorax sp. JY17]PIK15111.1 MAG: hypothetical protein CES88_12320 [Halobacteriovorax sp. JY17]